MQTGNGQQVTETAAMKRLPQIGRGECRRGQHDADDASALSDSADLVVTQIAPAVVDGAGPGVTDQRRKGGELYRFIEGGWTGVG